MAFRKHVLPMLHIPRPGGRGVSRLISLSGREVKAGGKVVEAATEVWLWGSGVASRRGLGGGPGGSILPIFPHASYSVRSPETTTSFLALFLLLVLLESVMQSGQGGVG